MLKALTVDRGVESEKAGCHELLLGRRSQCQSARREPGKYTASLALL